MSSSNIKKITVDEFDKTQPIDVMAQILLEMRGINEGIRDIRLDLRSLNGKVNLAGNLAAEANANSEQALAIVRRIDQNLTGIYELAKSGYDIATAVKSTMDSFRPEPDSSPEIIIDNGWVMAE